MIGREDERRDAWPPNCVFIGLPSDDIVACKQLEYSTLQELLDDIYSHYLRAHFEPGTYGKTWVLICRSTARVAAPLSWLRRSTSTSLRDAEPLWAAPPPAHFGVDCAVSLHQRAIDRVSSFRFADEKYREEYIERYKRVGSFWNVRSVGPELCFGLMTNNEHVIEEFFWGQTHPLKTLRTLLHRAMKITMPNEVAPSLFKYEAVFLSELFHSFRDDSEELGGKILTDWIG